MAKSEDEKTGALAAKQGRILSVKALVVVAALLVLAGGGYLAYRIYHQHHLPPSVKAKQEADALAKALLKNDQVAALAQAKKALAQNPNDMNAILTVANIEKSVNPNEAKQYYNQALDELKKQSNPDVGGKRPIVYYDAGYMAEQAGDLAQAKNYYQEAVKAETSSDSYDQGVAAQAQAALQRLQ